MKTFATTREQDVDEVLNSDSNAATTDDVALFKEKHKLVCAIFDKLR